MLKQLRENVWIGDERAYKNIEQLKTIQIPGISSVLIVADDLPNFSNDADLEPRFFKMGLRANRQNPPYIKDAVCHTALQMVNNGEIILIQSKTGLGRAAFVACRVVCEIEKRSIYEILQELKEGLPELNIGEAYF